MIIYVEYVSFNLLSFKSANQITNTLTWIIAANQWDERGAGGDLSESSKSRAAPQGRKVGSKVNSKAGSNKGTVLWCAQC